MVDVRSGQRAVRLCVPPLRRRIPVLKLGAANELKAVPRILLLNRQRAVLQKNKQQKTTRRESSYSSAGVEVNNRLQLSRVRIDESLAPSRLCVIADLDDVCEDGGAVLDDHVLQLGVNAVVLALEKILGGGDSSF